MSRENATYTVGDYWLDKRRDGKAPGIWQIARYAEKSRSVIYRSTKRTDLEDAKAVIHAYVAMERAKQKQDADEAFVVPQLMLYWQEYASEVIKPGVIAGSLRAFIGFLMQDEIGVGATVASLNQNVFKRFRQWRMKPHSFTVVWEGKSFPVASTGVTGESVQRNLDDIRAALNHAAANDRVPYVPKVPSVPTGMRSSPRDVRVSIDDLGAMVAVAKGDRDFQRWLLLMIGTGCRPEAALAFNPAVQWNGDLVDLHPVGRPRTKKRNPVVPVVRPLRTILAQWKKDGARPVLSRRTAWRTMRRTLGLPANVIPKTIRHTIATELRRRGVPGEQISGLLGHVAMSRITEVYAKYDPAYLGEARDVLTKIFREVLAARRTWLADHMLTKVGNKPRSVVAIERKKA